MGSRQKITAMFAAFLFIFCSVVNSQNVPVYEMIGKKVNSVINAYGKPAHRDKSDPTLECLFYQTSNLRMVFVSGSEGVFQAESTRSLNSAGSAKNHLDDIIKGCLEKEMKVDTINSEDFKISGDNIRAEITLFKNSYSNKYEVRIKATK